MNDTERRIIKRMIDQEHLEAVNAVNDRTRSRHSDRGCAIKELNSLFGKAAFERREEIRKKKADRPPDSSTPKKRKPKPSTTAGKQGHKSKPITGHDLHGHH